MKRHKAKTRAVFTHKEVMEALKDKYYDRIEAAGIKTGMVYLEMDGEILSVLQDDR